MVLIILMYNKLTQNLVTLNKHLLFHSYYRSGNGAQLSSTATAKSLQSCPTLCDPMDGSPPGFPIPGILQARTLEWVTISFSNTWKWKVKMKSLSRVRLQWPHGLQPTRLLRPWDFPGKSTGVGCHCLLQGLCRSARKMSAGLPSHLWAWVGRNWLPSSFTRLLARFSSSWVVALRALVPWWLLAGGPSWVLAMWVSPLGISCLGSWFHQTKQVRGAIEGVHTRWKMESDISSIFLCYR